MLRVAGHYGDCVLVADAGDHDHGGRICSSWVILTLNPDIVSSGVVRVWGALVQQQLRGPQLRSPKGLTSKFRGRDRGCGLDRGQIPPARGPRERCKLPSGVWDEAPATNNADAFCFSDDLSCCGNRVCALQVHHFTHFLVTNVQEYAYYFLASFCIARLGALRRSGAPVHWTSWTPAPTPLIVSTSYVAQKLHEILNITCNDIISYRYSLTCPLSPAPDRWSQSCVFAVRSIQVTPSDCLDIMLEYDAKLSTEYSIYVPKINERARVLCDMETLGGGWTVCTSVKTCFTV